jgi:hypothetical protein
VTTLSAIGRAPARNPAPVVDQSPRTPRRRRPVDDLVWRAG